MRTIAVPRAVNPLSFGRRPPPARLPRPSLVTLEDVRLFLWTFAAGFLSLSIYLA